MVSGLEGGAYVTNLGAVPAAGTNNDVFTLRLDEHGAAAGASFDESGAMMLRSIRRMEEWLAFARRRGRGERAIGFG